MVSPLKALGWEIPDFPTRGQERAISRVRAWRYFWLKGGERALGKDLVWRRGLLISNLRPRMSLSPSVTTLVSKH